MSAAGSAVNPARVMPDLVTPRRDGRHDLDSAVLTLQHRGVPLDRVRLESAGPGWRPGTVVRQSPPPGAPLTPDSNVTLAIAGTGTLLGLPLPLRDAHDEEGRIDRLCAALDLPIFKLGHFIRESGGFLTLRSGNAAVARRWIEDIFQVDEPPWIGDRAGGKLPWDESQLYAVARLLTTLHRTGGTAEGVQLALRMVFGLPVARVEAVVRRVDVPDAERTRLGHDYARLGVDAVLAGGVPVRAELIVEIGPVDYQTYLAERTEGRRAQRNALYRLVVPFHLYDPRQHESRGGPGGVSPVRERWVVGGPAAEQPLGDAARGPVLGRSSYLAAPTTPPPPAARELPAPAPPPAEEIVAAGTDHGPADDESSSVRWGAT